jgi:hypothetical protein
VACHHPKETRGSTKGRKHATINIGGSGTETMVQITAEKNIKGMAKVQCAAQIPTWLYKRQKHDDGIYSIY